MRHRLASESVTEGHPDKVCDLISDAILDACIEQDPLARVAVETLAKDATVVLAGEITTAASINVDAIVRATIRDIGYTDPSASFHADGVTILNLITSQSPEISAAVTHAADNEGDLGAGDQGIMFGYATDETPELMPLPILLAHRLASGLAFSRKSAVVPWLLPDGKTQVTVEYEDGVPLSVPTILVSTQHRQGISREDIRAFVVSHLAPQALGAWLTPDTEIIVNPSGSFVVGGPTSDAGVTGRKIIVDTYGGAARHGGGAFSGKDPTKVDRLGAYYARYVARQIVLRGLAKRAELQVSYAIGMARPLSVLVETFGTGDERAAQAYVHENFNFRPAAMLDTLHLPVPIFRSTTNYGHFGKKDLPWEA